MIRFHWSFRHTIWNFDEKHVIVDAADKICIKMATRAESLHGLPNMKEACSVMIPYRKLAMRVLNHTPMLGGGGYGKAA